MSLRRIHELRREIGELTGDTPCPLMTRQGNDPLPAVMSGGLGLLAELGRILNAWETEFTRVAEAAQARNIEEN